MIGDMGWPLAGLFAWLVAIAEFFGGIAILLGVGTRFSALWLAVISFVAWAGVKGFSWGFMAEGNLDILALGLTLGLLIMGPGSISLSAKMKKPAPAAAQRARVVFVERSVHQLGHRWY